MIKKIFLLLVLVSVLTLTGCGSKKKEEAPDLLNKIKTRGELVVGVKFDSKPFGFVENGKLQGYDIDIAHFMAKRLLGNERLVKFVEVTPSNRISKLNSGEVDMLIATMTITPQRQEVVDFSVPYFYTGQSLMVRRGSAIKTIGDLNGRRVIIVLGTTSEKKLRFLAPEAILKGYKSYKEGFEGLKEGKAEAMSTDDAILAGFVMDNKDFIMFPQKYTQEGYGIAFRKGPESAVVKREVNNAITQLRQKGHLSYLRSKWIPSYGKTFKE